MDKVIAIDGTAASGKGTLAKEIAKQLNYAYLDTGKLYRYVGYHVIQNGGDPEDEDTAIATAQSLSRHLKPEDLQDPELSSDVAGQAASKVGQFQTVRDALIDFQKNFAVNPPEPYQGSVLDGRDIGTVICPNAPVKLYIDAKTEIRAQRRHKELQSKGFSATYDAVLMDMVERDARDQGRKAAPMKPADDALIIDTSDMDIDEVLKTAMAYICEKLS